MLSSKMKQSIRFMHPKTKQSASANSHRSIFTYFVQASQHVCHIDDGYTVLVDLVEDVVTEQFDQVAITCF